MLACLFERIRAGGPLLLLTGHISLLIWRLMPALNYHLSGEKNEETSDSGSPGFRLLFHEFIRTWQDFKWKAELLDDPNMLIDV